VDYKNSKIKQYHKEGRALRTETTINDTRDFGLSKRLTNLPALRQIGFTANRRLLGVQRLSHNPIRGVLGDELPWEIGSVRGSLTTDGHLQVSVRGLVFANVPSVPANLRGINDESQFRALVSCLSDDGRGKVATENIATVGFPATTSGDSVIDTFVSLPTQCVAPIVFILSGSEDLWFAVTGSEAD